MYFRFLFLKLQSSLLPFPATHSLGFLKLTTIHFEKFSLTGNGIPLFANGVKAVVTTVYDVVSSFIDFFLAGISKAFGTEQIHSGGLYISCYVSSRLGLYSCPSTL